MLAENQSEIEKKNVVKVRAKNLEKQTKKIIGYFSHSRTTDKDLGQLVFTTRFFSRIVFF